MYQVFGALASGAMGIASQGIQNERNQRDMEMAKNMQYMEMQYNSQEAQKNRDFQQAERLASQEFEVDMWNRNNEYNSPAEQLKRLKEAGINPNSLGGNPNVSATPVTTNPSSGSQASYSSNLSSAMLGNTANMTSSFATLLNSFANVKKSNIESALKAWELKYNKKTEGLRIKQLETNIKYQEEQINDVIESAGMKRASKDEILARTSWMDKLNDSEIEERIARTTLLYNQSYDILKSLELQEKDVNSLVDLRSSEKSLNESTATLQGQQGAYIENQSKTEDVERALLEIEKKFAEEMQMPIGSTDEQFYFKLWKSGQLPSFIDEVLVNTERSKWKPRDWTIGDTPLTYDRALDYNWRTGFFNPKTNFIDVSDPLFNRR